MKTLLVRHYGILWTISVMWEITEVGSHDFHSYLMHLYASLTQASKSTQILKCLHSFIYNFFFSTKCISSVSNCPVTELISLPPFLSPCACLPNGFECEFPKQWKGSPDCTPPPPLATPRLHSPTCCRISLSAGGTQSSWTFYSVMVLGSGLACRSAISWRWDITTGRASS